MLFITLLIVNIIYVIFEFAFNFHLLNVSSGTATLADIHNLEVLGRTFASFGATFLFWKIISSTDIKKKALVLLFGTFIIYPSVYFAQKEVIDYLAYNSSVESRVKNANLYLLKKGIQNNSLEIKGFPSAEEIKNDTEAKVFVSTLGLMTLGNNVISDYIMNNKQAISQQVFMGDANKENLLNEHYKNFNKTLAKKDEVWNEYNINKADIANRMKQSSSEAEGAYAKIAGNSTNAYRDYRGYASKFQAGAKFANGYAKDVGVYLKKFNACSSLDCYKQEDRKFMIWQEQQLSKIKLSGSEAPIVNFSNFCRVGSSSGTFYIGAVFRKYNTQSTYSQSYTDPSRAGYAVNCQYNGVAHEALVLNRLEKKFTELSGFDSPYYSNEAQFSSSGGYTLYVNNYMLKTYGLKMGNNWSVSNKSSFINSFMSSYKDKLLNEASNALKSKYGFALSMDLDKSAFLSNADVNKIFVKNFGPYYFNTNKEQFSESEFLKSVYPVISSKLAADYSSQNFETEQGINMVKAMIIPPVALLFSLFFGIANLIVLIKSVMYLFLKFVAPRFSYKNLVLKLFTLVSGTLIIVIPFVFDNAYTASASYSKMIGSLESYNSVVAFCVDWLFRFEPIIYNIGSFLSPVVHFIQSINVA